MMTTTNLVDIISYRYKIKEKEKKNLFSFVVKTQDLVS